MSKFKSFKRACAVAVSTLLVLQSLAPSVAVIADEISDAEGDGSTVIEIVDDNSADQADVIVNESDDITIEFEVAEDDVTTDATEDFETEDPAEAVDATAPPAEETPTEPEAEESETVDISEAEPSESIEEVVPSEVEETEDSSEPTDDYIAFDQYYMSIDESLVQTSDLMVQTGDASVFTYNTPVVSNYDDIYILSFASVEEARYAYSYYADKVEFICDLSSAVSIATGDDTADLSDLNNGDDAISNLNDISVSDYSGYIALIDTGANADANYSVVGDDTSDYNGHGTQMYEYILAENPDAQVVSIKVTDGRSANAADIYAGFRLAIEMNVSVINFSMTGYDIEKNQIIKDIIQEAIDNGIVVIGAAGNSNADAHSYIAGCIDSAIVVGAVNSDGTKTLFSNYNADLYVVADSTSEAAARYAGIYTSGAESDKVYDLPVTESDNTVEVSDEDTQDFLDWLNSECAEGGYWILSVNESGETYYEFVSTDFETAVSSSDGYTWLGDNLNLAAMGLSEGSSGSDSGTCYVSDSNHDGCGTVSSINSTSGSAIKLSDFRSEFDAVCARHFGEEVNHHAAALSGSCYYSATYQVVRDGDKLKIQWTVHLSSRSDISAPSWHSEELEVYWYIGVSLNPNRTNDYDAYRVLAYYKVNGGSAVYITGTPSTGSHYSIVPLTAVNSAASSLSNVVNLQIAGVADGARDEFGGIRYFSGPTGAQVPTDSWEGTGSEHGTMTWTWEATDDTQVYMGVLEGTGPINSYIGLTKITASGYECVTNGNGCYSLDGTQYTLYSDAACTNAVHVFNIGADGHTDTFTVEGANFGSSYYLKETVAGPGYALDGTVYKIDVSNEGTMSVSRYSGSASFDSVWHGDDRLEEVIVSDTPLLDPFQIQLQKVNPNAGATEATMDSATFHICYYAADYAIDADLSSAVPTDDFYVSVSDPATIHTLGLKQLSGNDSSFTVTGDVNYLAGVYAGAPNALVKTQLPLGTYTVQESGAPTGYVLNPTIYRVRIYEQVDATTGQHSAVTQIINQTTGTPVTAITVDSVLTAPFTAIYEPTQYVSTFQLVKDISDTAVYNNRAGFEYNMYWKKSDGTYVLFATGISQSDGRVYWTYKMANYYHLEEDGNTLTLLTNTKTYTLEVVAGEDYEVRETIKDLTYGNMNSGLIYSSITPVGWTRGTNYFYKVFNVPANTSAAASIYHIDNGWDYASLSVSKSKPTGDLFDLTMVDFTLYTYVGGVRKNIATGTVDANGNITWTRVDTSGIGVYQAGNYDRRTSVNTVANLPFGTYYVEETWDKVYIDSIDPETAEAIELFATNNASGWTTSADGTKYVSTKTAVLNAQTTVNLGAAVNDWHYQWFSANKVVTVAGDASTIDFELYYNNGTKLVLLATGYAETDGIGTYPIIWDTYTGPAEFVDNDGQKIVLPEGSYEIREIVPETYYQNGQDNVPYTYMVPNGWQNHIGTNGHSDYFYKTFNAANNATVTISSVNPTNVRIEAELTIRKIEQTDAPSRTFTFKVYYRGNEDEPMNVGDFSDEYLLDTVIVTTTDGSGYATLTKIPEGWYEVVEVDNDGWEAVWMNTTTNTANGKLVHASSEGQTVSHIVIQDNIKLFGVAYSGILINNTVRPTITLDKIDSWTGEVIDSTEHPENVHLTFYLYADQNGNGELDQAEIDFGYTARIDGGDTSTVKFQNLAAGKYIVHEVATVNGYYLTAADVAAEVMEPENYVIDMANMPYTETIKVTKVDNETDEPLSGAVFTVFVDSNDNGVFDEDDQVAKMWNDANGNNEADEGEVSDAVLFETSAGVYESYGLHFNDGGEFGNRYFLVETQAPENYFFVNEDGTFSDHSRVETFVIEKKDTTAADFQVGNPEFAFRNQTGTVFAKKTNQNGEFLSGAEFTVYADEDCTQAIGVLVEDTAGETYSYKGLGLGTFYLKETKAPTGFEIDPNAYAFEVTLNEVHPVVVNFMSYKYNIDGAFVDVEIHTTANDPLIANPDDSYSIIARESEETTIVDRVYFDGLIIGKEYEVTGDLVYQKAFDGHEAGEVIVSQTVTFTAGDENDEAQGFTVNADGKTVEGYIDVVFTVNTTTITTEIVAFEEIKSLPEGMVVGTHNDLGDVPQTKVIPHIGTTITDQQTMINQASLGGTVVLNDAVAYVNLVKGQTYTVNGVLYDAETGEAYKDAEGNEVTGTATFTADGEIVKTVVVDGQVVDLVNGTVNVTFELDVTDLGGQSFVAYEYLLVAGADGSLVQIASHEDINDEGQTIHVPDIKTNANVPNEDVRLAPATEAYTFTDTVKYENLIPGKTYTVTGVLKNAETGETILDENGEAYTGSTEFTAETASGSVDVEFTVNTVLLQGKSVVVFEDLYYEGIRIATHSDLTDKDQTFDIPEVHTTASTAVGNTVEYSEEAVVTDRVFYSNLVPGKEYKITGTLVVKSTGEAVVDSEGNTVTESVLFTPEESEGYVDIDFVFDATLYVGETLVAFETLSFKGLDYVVHADINDEDQSTYVPEIHTTATTTTGNVVEYSTQAVITDRVFYTNLEVGKTYEVTGTLVVKSTGDYVRDANGDAIVAMATFEAEDTEGYVDVTFTFDATLYQGQTIVAFETLTSENVVYAVHADIEDEDQTVYVPEIHTTATDANGNKVFQATESATIVDEIAYTNLEPGKTYRADGVLMDKSTGAPLLIDGQEVHASAEFTPEAANGTVTVTFTFNASALAGKSLVVFENVYDVSGAFVVNPETGEETFDTTIETLVATHEDIDDEGQTVTITDAPKTGDTSGFGSLATGAMIAAGVAAVTGAAFVALRKKNKKQGGEA